MIPYLIPPRPCISCIADGGAAPRELLPAKLHCFWGMTAYVRPVSLSKMNSAGKAIRLMAHSPNVPRQSFLKQPNSQILMEGRRLPT